ncbi:hypothetical protein RIF29_09510 [Crotalaria pallida]|uniref:Uncharacterized protein n=1 Tax=Crotalaria pallida TaxID=3830 RepID=A0AAN9FY83_CROPI
MGSLPLRGRSERSFENSSPEPPAAQPRQRWVLCPCGDRAKEVLRIQEKASQKVTEACKGFLGPDGDWPSSARAEGSLTARPTRSPVKF